MATKQQLNGLREKARAFDMMTKAFADLCLSFERDLHEVFPVQDYMGSSICSMRYSAFEATTLIDKARQEFSDIEANLANEMIPFLQGGGNDDS